MATVTTVDVTGKNGSDTFPLNKNDILDMVETIASQNIRAVKSANRLNDALYEYKVDKGKVIEEAIIEMAKAQAFDKDSFDFSPKDPTVQVKYFNNYEEKQFQTTVRDNDIRKVLAGENSAEEVASKIIDSLNQGEGAYDFENSRNLIYISKNGTDYSTILGGSPKNMKGVLYALRDMYNHLISNNEDLTSAEYVSATPESDVRIFISDKLMNLIDVVELAHVFNLSKEELFGKLIVVQVSDLSENLYLAGAYDVKAFGKATRLYEMSEDRIGKGLYQNYYLTTERAFFYNGLFKACYIDCSSAATTELATIIDEA